MHTEDRLKQKLWEKISLLPPEHILLVTDFINALDQPNSDRILTLAAAKLSEPALQKVWDNPDDAEYDQL